MRERLSLEEFERCAEPYNRSVGETQWIDRFCSRSEWIVSFHLAFLPDRELHLYRRGDSFVALAAREHPTVGLYLEPLENMWCFACPLTGSEAPRLLADVAAAHSQPDRPLPIVLSGVPLAGELLPALVETLGDIYEIRAVDSTRRFVASLAGGMDGFLSRRSASMRRNLRAATRKAVRAGIAFQSIEIGSVADFDAARALERILSIEVHSWKGLEGVGVDRGGMLEFYRNLLPRLAARSALRLLIARLGDRDLGYVYGGVVGDHFRGLQVSYDHEFQHLSLGNLLQQEMIRLLCEEGVRTYDLGTRSEYKQRWGEEGLETVTLVLRKPL